MTISAEEIRIDFLRDLKRLVSKYDAEFYVIDDGQDLPEIGVEIPTKFEGGSVISELSYLNLGRWFDQRELGKMLDTTP